MHSRIIIIYFDLLKCLNVFKLNMNKFIKKVVIFQILNIFYNTFLTKEKNKKKFHANQGIPFGNELFSLSFQFNNKKRLIILIPLIYEVIINQKIKKIVES